MFDPNQLLRPHLRSLVPYSSARDDYKGSEGVFLDANENPYGSITAEKWNRYPDPYQKHLKARIAEIKGVNPEQIFLGNGSDEPIDLLFRAFCEPGVDNVIINPPTYGMYKVSADINNVEIREVLMTEGFDLDVNGILNATDNRTKIVFICSPNNPSGNDVDLGKIEQVIKGFDGLVVVDEAYIDFTNRASFADRLVEFPNLIVLQTFSKAWGLAALRLGMAFCSEEILSILNKIKAPYNLSGLTQDTVLKALANAASKDEMVSDILRNRAELKTELEALDIIEEVYPTDANFFLVRINNAKSVYKKLIEQQVILRDRSSVVLCDDGIRITVGTKSENRVLIDALRKLK
ncbi:histidinol-phosphate transaminase [Roseivirga sp. E12]|uniref:histidinol-phosphate transaminase n=1 Tax=Roseivirga sp. E12 TaxID=2819237 RepID=UPI001ABCFFAA|nr:histidinol-phosphate transaminase [Roseivirga sp. E12]MBO3698147.1 histidinol-phosphate transaminase [Roseivirga sp. E12]